jgi:hypothetical protein
MANTVLVLSRIAADNVDAYNRSAICSEDVMNGTVVTLESGFSETAGKEFVWTATPLDDADKHAQYWMACAPEVNVLADGSLLYKGISVDPRNYTNVKNTEFDVFSVQIGDCVQISTPFFANEQGPATIGATAKFVEYTADTGWKAIATATSAYTGLRFAIRKAMPFAIGTDSEPGWILERVQ